MPTKEVEGAESNDDAGKKGGKVKKGHLKKKDGGAGGGKAAGIRVAGPDGKTRRKVIGGKKLCPACGKMLPVEASERQFTHKYTVC